jgi:hypothetical protein
MRGERRIVRVTYLGPDEGFAVLERATIDVREWPAPDLRGLLDQLLPGDPRRDVVARELERRVGE